MSKLCWPVVKVKKSSIAASKIMGSRPWPFGVTWRHLLRDHSTRGGRLPMGGPLWPCVYLAPLWRYEASNVGRTDAQVILNSVQCYALHWTDKNL